MPVRAPDVRFYLRHLHNHKRMSEKPVLKRKRRPASATRRCAFACCQIRCFNYGLTAKLEWFCWPSFSRSEDGNTTAETRGASNDERTTFAAVSERRAPWPDQSPQTRTARRCATVLVQIITCCQEGRKQKALIYFRECTTTCQIHSGIRQLLCTDSSLHLFLKMNQIVAKVIRRP